MKRTIIYVFLSTFLFSTMEIVLNLAGPIFAPLQMNLLRFTIGGITLLLLSAKVLKQESLQIWKNWKLFVITGFICVVLSMTFYQLAVINAKASVVAVFFSCNPIFALIFSQLILGEKLSRFNVISVVISIIGLVVIVNPMNLSNFSGIILATTSAVLFGLYSIISRKGSKKFGYNGVIMTTFTFITGAIELLLIICVSNIPVIANFLGSIPSLSNFARTPIVEGISFGTVPLLIYIGVGVTGLGFGFYFLAMERSNVATASLVFFIKPGLAPLLASLILGERLTSNIVVGIVFILSGSVITLLGDWWIERANNNVYKSNL